MSIKKFVFGFAMVAVFLGVTFTSVSAQSVADLQAQIQLLMSQIATLSGSAPVTSAGYTFTKDLTIGSTGADVTALQNYLISNGYSIPAGATGYFGAQTKTAVIAWQTASGISPASGYFGPISRGAMNSMPGSMTPPPTTGGSTPTPALCPNGMTLASNCTTAPGATSVTLCPNGMTLASNCTTAPGATTGSTTGDDGSITIASSALVSSGTSVKKGETRDILSTRLKATGGNVSVNRVEVKFSERPWLTMSQVQIKNGNGTVLATKALTGSADATEVTVGSDYRVRFEGINLVVTPSTDVDLVVAVTVLASSDKITGQTITTSIPASGIRTTNGINFSETIGPSSSFTFTLPTTGSASDIYTSISPNSPVAGFVTVAAGTTQTPNVVLGKFRVKSQNTGATLNSVNFTLQESTTTNEFSSLFSNMRLSSGSLNYGATTLATTTTFTNLQIPLPLDQWVELSLTSDVAGASVTSGISASTTLDASTISGVDTNFNSLTVTNASDITSSDQTFLQSGVSVASTAKATTGDCTQLVANGPNTSCLATFTFTLVNTGSNVVYMSKNPGLAFGTSTVPASNASSTITLINVSGSTDPGDVAGSGTGVTATGSFAIQPGAQRDFTALGSVKNNTGTTGVYQLSIDSIRFGSASTVGAQGVSGGNAANSITAGLGALKATTNF